MCALKALRIYQHYSLVSILLTSTSLKKKKTFNRFSFFCEILDDLKLSYVICGLSILPVVPLFFFFFFALFVSFKNHNDANLDLYQKVFSMQIKIKFLCLNLALNYENNINISTSSTYWIRKISFILLAPQNCICIRCCCCC